MRMPALMDGQPFYLTVTKAVARLKRSGEMSKLVEKWDQWER